MNQDIHTHLEKLKTELSKLEPAIMHLQKADENATALISTLYNIQEEYSKHLQNIEQALIRANEDYQKHLIKVIEASTLKITGASELLLQSNLSFENQIREFLSGYEVLVSAVSNLIDKIDKVDFPSRLDKLDSTVSSINQGLQNTQMRIGDLERNLKDDIQARAKELFSKVNESENSLNQKLDSTQSNINRQFEDLFHVTNFIKIILFVSIGLSAAIIVLHFLIK